MKGTLAITGDADADELINTDPLALLLGMLLDQQFPMERAFLGPYVLKQRLGGVLDPQTVAAHDPEAFAAVVQGPAGRAPVLGLDGRPGASAGSAHPGRVPGRRRRRVGHRDRRRRTVQAAPRAAGLWRAEVEDLHRSAGEALRHPAGRVGAGGRRLLGRHASISRRHRRARRRSSRSACSSGPGRQRQKRRPTDQSGVTERTPGSGTIRSSSPSTSQRLSRVHETSTPWKLVDDVSTVTGDPTSVRNAVDGVIGDARSRSGWRETWMVANLPGHT